MNDCVLMRELFSEHIDGRLNAEQTKTIQEHLARCQSCSMEFEKLRNVSRLLKELPRQSPPPDFEQKLGERIKSRTKIDYFVKDLLKVPEFRVPVMLTVIGLFAFFVLRGINLYELTTSPIEKMPAKSAPLEGLKVEQEKRQDMAKNKDLNMPGIQEKTVLLKKSKDEFTATKSFSKIDGRILSEKKEEKAKTREITENLSAKLTSQYSQDEEISRVSKEDKQNISVQAQKPIQQPLPEAAKKQDLLVAGSKIGLMETEETKIIAADSASVQVRLAQKQTGGEKAKGNVIPADVTAEQVPKYSLFFSTADDVRGTQQKIEAVLSQLKIPVTGTDYLKGEQIENKASAHIDVSITIDKLTELVEKLNDLNPKKPIEKIIISGHSAETILLTIIIQKDSE